MKTIIGLMFAFLILGCGEEVAGPSTSELNGTLPFPIDGFSTVSISELDPGDEVRVFIRKDVNSVWIEPEFYLNWNEWMNGVVIPVSEPGWKYRIIIQN